MCAEVVLPPQKQVLHNEPASPPKMRQPEFMDPTTAEGARGRSMAAVSPMPALSLSEVPKTPAEEPAKYLAEPPAAKEEKREADDDDDDDDDEEELSLEERCRIRLEAERRVQQQQTPAEEPAAEVEETEEESPTETLAERHAKKMQQFNRSVIRGANRRDWAIARCADRDSQTLRPRVCDSRVPASELLRARADAATARMEAEQAAGVETLAERSRRLVEEKRQREAAAAAARPATPEPAAPPAAPAAPAFRPPPPQPLPGATEATVAAELQRWPSPPSGAACSLEAHVWPLYPDHALWLDEMAAKYAFADAGEALRHLVFAANGEQPPTKKLIFLQIRRAQAHAPIRPRSLTLTLSPRARAGLLCEDPTRSDRTAWAAALTSSHPAAARQDQSAPPPCLFRQVRPLPRGRGQRGRRPAEEGAAPRRLWLPARVAQGGAAALRAPDRREDGARHLRLLLQDDGRQARGRGGALLAPPPVSPPPPARAAVRRAPRGSARGGAPSRGVELASRGRGRNSNCDTPVTMTR